MAGAVLAGAGLVGCDGANAEPEPDPEPTTTQPEEPATPDPEETDSEPGDDEPGPQDYPHPEPGPDIDDEGQAGAEAAAVYFVELYSYIHATGDFEAWDRLSADACGFCSGVRESVAEIYGSGGYVVTSPANVLDVRSQVWPEDSADFAVAVVSEDPGFQDYDSDGELVEEFPPETVRSWVLLEYSADGWKVTGSEVEAVE
ncbi:DUF6318 family protein [Pseudactinotalea sp. Z1739]|uniref:DUF6318 family protein n=1 Tax=Pseudactinotalea sp. Z1739 TaxID=3413028 RepID=UPI003C7B749C